MVDLGLPLILLDCINCGIGSFNLGILFDVFNGFQGV